MSKRHRFILFFSVLFFVAGVVQAQGDKKSYEVQQADKYFNVNDYVLAVKYYKDALSREPDNVYVMYQMAECYRLYFDYDNAEKWYKSVVDKGDDQYTLAQYFYALMLKINGKYIPAGENFEFFIATYTPKDDDDTYFDQALLHYNGCILAQEQIALPVREYNFVSLEDPINTTFSDYAVSIADNDSSIVFTSARKSKKDDEYTVLGGAFSDLYWFKKTENGWEEEDLKKSGFDKVNEDMNEGAGCFNSDNSKFYFTRCDEEHDEVIECVIYMTKKEEEKWTEPIKLNSNINAKGYWNAHPSLSANDDTLYFASKRPGGYGQHDIWYSVDKNKTDRWVKAVNLGDKVNTPYIEMSPFVHSEENLLFFSSDGHEGFGGLDVFLAKGEGFSTIRNIGLPFNSNRDDFNFVLGTEKGFISSNRDGGSGHDDIYQFNIDSTLNISTQISPIDTTKSITISAYILDDDDVPVKDIIVMLFNKETGAILKFTKTDEKGYFEFANLDPDLDYSVVISQNEELYSMSDLNLDDLKDMDVTELTDINIKGSDKDFDNGGKVDPDGDFTGGRQLFENIYFDFDKSSVRREAKKVLDDLIAYFNRNPGIKIEVKANTDSKGSDAYNYKLAKRRADRSIKYLKNKGLSDSDFIIYAQGEGVPIASNANPVGRQLNRRVEFYISGQPKVGFETKNMAYVVQEGDDAEAIARKFNMSVDELKELNDLETLQLQLHSQVRVRRGPGDNTIAPVTMAYAGKPSMFQNYDPTKTTSSGGFTEADIGTPSQTEYNQGVQYGRDNGSGYYTVLPKNTLFSISKIFGVSVKEIKKWNKLRGNSLRAGQVLQVREFPTGSASDHMNHTALADAGVTVSLQKGQILELGGQTVYVVKEGDTFYTIARQFDMEFEQLRKLNNLPNYLLQAGMTLKVVPKAGQETINMEEIKKEVRGDYYQAPDK